MTHVVRDRLLAGTIVVALLALAPRVVTAACGDVDGDGVCDAIDACFTADLFAIREPALIVGRLDTPTGDDTLRFSGTLRVPASPVIDPGTDGVRFALHHFFGDPIAVAAVPGGAGWSRDAQGRVWVYRDHTGQAGGITRVVVKQVEPNVVVPSVVPRATFAFLVEARGGAFPLTAADSLYLTFAMGAVGNQLQCGDTTFIPGRERTCSTKSARTLECGSGRRVGPCHASDPNDLVVCDVDDAVAAQARYFARHHSYFSGDCDDLPTFVASPGVACNTAGTDSDFSVTAIHPSMRWSIGCTWTNTVPPTQQNLVCS
jgi:hypothetical protein